MIIKFNEIDETIMPEFKGGNKEFNARIFQDPDNKILYGKLIAGASIGNHTHETNSEIIYVLSGKGKAVYNGETVEITPGICHYCPKGESHSLINDGDEDLVFFAVIPE